MQCTACNLYLLIQCMSTDPSPVISPLCPHEGVGSWCFWEYQLVDVLQDDILPPPVGSEIRADDPCTAGRADVRFPVHPVAAARLLAVLRNHRPLTGNCKTLHYQSEKCRDVHIRRSAALTNQNTLSMWCTYVCMSCNTHPPFGGVCDKHTNTGSAFLPSFQWLATFEFYKLLNGDMFKEKCCTNQSKYSQHACNVLLAICTYQFNACLPILLQSSLLCAHMKASTADGFGNPSWWTSFRMTSYHHFV